MSKLPVPTRVITAKTLEVVTGWAGRKPGARGTVVAREDFPSGVVYSVYHDDGSPTARYHPDELTPIRERAREVAAPTPEQELLERLEQRLTAAETEHQRFVAAIAVELVTLETRVERIERAEEVCRQGADRLNEEAAIEAAQTLMGLGSSAVVTMLRNRSRRPWEPHLGPGPEKLIAAADALEAIPELLRRLEHLEQSPRRNRIQAWQALERACREHQGHVGKLIHYQQTPGEPGIWSALQVLDELPDDESPPDSAPPLPGVNEDALRLRAELELERSTLATLLEAANPGWHPDGVPMTDHLGQLLDDLRDALTKTELDPVDGETLPQLAARVVAELRAQMQWGSELFRACEAVVGPQPAGPGGEDEVVTRLRAIPVALQELLDYATERQAAHAAVPPPGRLPDRGTIGELIQRIRRRVEGLSALLDGAAEDERITRERLANMMGHAPDDYALSEMLTWIEPRVGVVRDLCETIPVEGLRGVATGLEMFGGDDYCPAAVVSAALHELAALEDPLPDPDAGPDSNAEVCFDCEHGLDSCECAPPELAQPVQDEPS